MVVRFEYSMGGVLCVVLSRMRCGNELGSGIDVWYCLKVFEAVSVFGVGWE